MNYSDEIKAIKSKQEQLIELQENIKKDVKILSNKVEEYFKIRLKKDFPGIYFDYYIDFGGGCLTNEWKPNSWIYSVEGLNLYKEGCWSENFIVKPAPIDLVKLEKFLNDFSEETSIQIRILKHGC